MPAHKKDPYEHISTPPSEEVRWQVSCTSKTRSSREDAGDVEKYAEVIVTARTWADAKPLAFQEFAGKHGIYEPEDVKAFVLRDARPVAICPTCQRAARHTAIGCTDDFHKGTATPQERDERACDSKGTVPPKERDVNECVAATSNRKKTDKKKPTALPKVFGGQGGAP